MPSENRFSSSPHSPNFNGPRTKLWRFWKTSLIDYIDLSGRGNSRETTLSDSQMVRLKSRIASIRQCTPRTLLMKVDFNECDGERKRGGGEAGSYSGGKRRRGSRGSLGEGRAVMADGYRVIVAERLDQHCGARLRRKPLQFSVVRSGPNTSSVSPIRHAAEPSRGTWPPSPSSRCFPCDDTCRPHPGPLQRKL